MLLHKGIPNYDTGCDASGGTGMCDVPHHLGEVELERCEVGGCNRPPTIYYVGRLWKAAAFCTNHEFAEMRRITLEKNDEAHSRY